MKKSLSVVLVILALLVALSACSNNGGTGTTDTTAAATETAETAKSSHAGETITLYNWDDYINPDVITLFTKETGINVRYLVFTTNEDMYAKISSGAGSYDLIFPSDYIIERMIKKDELAKLNFDNIPNYANIMSWLKTAAYDPTGEFSVPYMWGTVGILYNTEMVDEPVTSWNILFDEKYKNNVIQMDSYRDCLGTTLKLLGYSLNTHDTKALNEAKDKLIAQKRADIVKAYQVDETKDKMVAGEAALALVWSGDALYAIEKNDKLDYAVPMEGSNIWVDGVCIPKNSQHKEAAEMFINFLCREDIARMNMEYIWYSTPNQKVVDSMSEEEKNDLTLNPTQDIIERCEYFEDVLDYLDVYEEIWSEIKLTR